MADRNGNPIVPGSSYVLVGKVLRDDGSTVLVDVGQRVISATGNELAPAVAGIGTAMLGGDITSAGKALLDDANAAAQRSTLGLGSSATTNIFGSGDPLGVLTAIASFAALTHTHNTIDINSGTLDAARLPTIQTAQLGGDITSAGKALLDDASASAQRTTLGLGSSATLNIYGSGDPLGVLTAISAFAALSHTHAAGDTTSGVLAAARGGTGHGSFTTGDILYWNGSAWQKLGIGSEGQVLKVEGGVPIWADP